MINVQVEENNQWSMAMLRWKKIINDQWSMSNAQVEENNQ